MKRFDFPIDRHQSQWVFAPIRTKKEALTLLIKATKAMLAPTAIKKEEQTGSITLIISKMSRLLFHSSNKTFSIAFPFLVREDKTGIYFYSHEHPNIDSKTTSDILALLDQPYLFDTKDVLEFADPICSACDIDVDLWCLFRNLLLLEDGYIRYDDDRERVNGHKHPRHHLDFFYSQGTTFKAGLRRNISDGELIDILNIETDCHYLHPAI